MNLIKATFVVKDSGKNVCSNYVHQAVLLVNSYTSEWFVIGKWQNVHIIHCPFTKCLCSREWGVVLK